MIVYGSSVSPFVRKVLAYATERGIAVEARQTAPNSPDPDFVAASPFRKIPAIRDGDFCLCDSSAIIHYLEAKYTDEPLIPAEPEARGKVVWFDEFADTILVACGGKMFFNRIVGPLFMGVPGDAAVADKAEKEELPPIFAYLESVATDDFLVGGALTLADIAVASPFVNLAHLGIAPDRALYPRLSAYVDRMLSRPSFAPLVETETAFLQKMKASA